MRKLCPTLTRPLLREFLPLLSLGMFANFLVEISLRNSTDFLLFVYAFASTLTFRPRCLAAFTDNVS